MPASDQNTTFAVDQYDSNVGAITFGVDAIHMQLDNRNQPSTSSVTGIAAMVE